MECGSVEVQDRATGETKARYECVPWDRIPEIEGTYRGMVFCFLYPSLVNFSAELARC